MYVWTYLYVYLFDIQKCKTVLYLPYFTFIVRFRKFKNFLFYFRKSLNIKRYKFILNYPNVVYDILILPFFGTCLYVQ